ncbi:hypothetical protein HK104_002075, partial [Borealophlyctis nickersoniae]
MAERRSSRKRKVQQSEASAAWYVGYAEDGESVEAIMKKFEELDRMKQEVASQQQQQQQQQQQPTGDGDATPGDGEVVPTEESAFTQRQLEELFKRTSAFTVKSATRLADFDDDELNDVELWRLEAADAGDEEYREEDDYYIVDDDFWDEEFGSAPSRSKHSRKLASAPKAPSSRGGGRNDRESILARYKVMSVQMQDRNGNFFVMKKRICGPDPHLPTYVRIPPVPVPRSWVKVITPLPPSVEQVPGCRYYEADVLSFHLASLGKKFQVIHMDPPFLLPGEEPVPGKISVKEFSTLPIPSVITHGFLFVWTEKELTPLIIRAAEKWGFRYVENFCWIKRDVGNRIVREGGKYFSKSKVTCLILRKEGDIELRHQRSPDCEFDFIKPAGPDDTTQEKPKYIFDVIETLLPNAVYGPDNTGGERMLD